MHRAVILLSNMWNLNSDLIGKGRSFVNELLGKIALIKIG